MYQVSKPVYSSSYLSAFFSFIASSMLILLTLTIGYMLTLMPHSIWSLPLFYPLELRLPAPFNGLNHYDWFGLLAFFKPQWTLLLVIYWAIARPQIMGIVLAWCAGLVLDILQVGLVGEYAIVFASVCYLTLKLRSRILYFHIIQQMFVVFILLGIAQFLVLWIQFMMGHPPTNWGYWGSSIGGALLWPLLVCILPKPER